MPWYYAGPEAKPVGPVTLEELQARCLNGTLAPETYVIEHTGQPGEHREWKRYRDLFPSHASAQPPPPPIPLPATALPPVPSHPLFPSAGPATGSSSFSILPQPPLPLASRPVNALCLWGFVLGLGGFLFSPFCGIGLFPALPGFFLSLVGIFQMQKNTTQSGRGLAFWGLGLSALAILISLIIALVLIMPRIQANGWTIMEQTTNDSD